MKKLVFVLLFVFLLAGCVVALDGSSTSFSTDTKADSGTVKNASSTSFTQRFFAGVHVVGQYAVNLLNGRFGVLDTGPAPIGINITYPLNNSAIPRGDGSTTGEDPLGIVPNSINITAVVYRTDTSAGISSATCYFYEDMVLIGSSSTNSSGDCIVQYYKNESTIGIRNIFANFTSPTGYVSINDSSINISLEKYVSTLTMGGLRSNGKYYDGDTSTLTISIRKTNETVTDQLYDPQNLTATAMNSENGVRSVSYYPGSISRSSQGIYVASAVLDYGTGADEYIKWELKYSDDGYSNYLGSGLHSDEEICAADFGGWSEWSTCVSGSQTRSRTDSTGCTEVESQSCTSDGSGGPGPGTCSNECTSGATQTTCLTSSSVGTRTCGNYDDDSCTEWSSYSSSSCSSGVCSAGQCVQACEPTYECGVWGECVNGQRSRTCEDTSCGEGITTETQACTVCIEQYQCGAWSSCNNGQRSRTCTEIACGTGKTTTETQACTACIESWTCDWTQCAEGDEFSYPYNCVDNNACGTTKDKPKQITCGVRDTIVPRETQVNDDGTECDVDWGDCTGWSACDVSYDVNDVLSGKSTASGTSERTCVDKNGCTDRERVEIKTCRLGLPIEARSSQWCFEDYIEIYDTSTGELVSRIKEEQISELGNLTRVDISFLNEGEGGSCSFCFDGVKNYDEEGVDCGGEYCGACVGIYSFFDWAFWVVVGSWTMFGLLLIVLWRREEEEKGEEGLWQEIKEGVKELEISGEEEKRIEAAIEGYFHRIFASKPEVRQPRVEPERVVYVKPPRSERQILIDHLKKKLREWKKAGYSGTAELEAKIHRLEAKEKSFFGGVVASYRARRASARALKERELRGKERAERAEENEKEKEIRNEKAREAREERRKEEERLKEERAKAREKARREREKELARIESERKWNARKRAIKTWFGGLFAGGKKREERLVERVHHVRETERERVGKGKSWLSGMWKSYETKKAKLRREKEELRREREILKVRERKDKERLRLEREEEKARLKHEKELEKARIRRENDKLRREREEEKAREKRAKELEKVRENKERQRLHEMKAEERAREIARMKKGIVQGEEKVGGFFSGLMRSWKASSRKRRIESDRRREEAERLRELKAERKLRMKRAKELERQRIAREKEIAKEKAERAKVFAKERKEREREAERESRIKTREERLRRIKAGVVREEKKVGGFFSGLVSSWKKSSAERARRREHEARIKEAEKKREERLKEIKKERAEGARREELRKKEEKKRREERVKELKSHVKVKKKEHKAVVKHIKKQIKHEKKKPLGPERKAKIAELEAKLKKWRAEGFYGTAELEAEIRRLKKG